MCLADAPRVVNLDIALGKSAKSPLKESTIVALESDSAVVVGQTSQVANVVGVRVDRIDKIAGVGLCFLLVHLSSCFAR